MSSHLCTTDSLFAGSLKVRTKCWVCRHEGENELGYIGERCSTCGAVTNLEDTWPDTVTMRRERLKLTRKQMGELTGYSPKSIKRYEFVRCTRPYFDLTGEILHWHFLAQGIIGAAESGSDRREDGTPDEPGPAKQDAPSSNRPTTDR